MIPISIAQKIANNRRRKGAKKAAGVKPSVSERVLYQKHLFALVRAMMDAVTSELVPLLRRLEPQYVKPRITSDSRSNFIQDAYAAELNRTMLQMSRRARDIGGLAERISSEMVNGVNNKQRRQFYKSIERSIGVNLNGIVQEPGVADVLESKVMENVSLIQSLPDEYYKKINTIVNDMTSRGRSSSSLIKQLRKAGIATKKRAKLIARDQTQKLNSAITQSRQEALGITEYEWQTSSDERVRESHKRNNGKTFRWDSPPAETGHPGEDIQCRCVALPLIDLDNIRR